jgi:hypothetical protein
MESFDPVTRFWNYGEAAKGWKFHAVVEEFAVLVAQADFGKFLGDTVDSPRLQRVVRDARHLHQPLV